MSQDTRHSVLPKQMPKEDRALLETWGVKFGDDRDGLFVNVTLPDGWTQQPVGSRGSNLLDVKQRIRATIFHKPDLHDGFANLRVLGRYSVSMDQHCDGQGKPIEQLDEATHLRIVAKDGRTDLKVFAILPRIEHPKRTFEAADAAEDWLTERFPKWKDRGAYWD